jgi:hypothetical protein
MLSTTPTEDARASPALGRALALEMGSNKAGTASSGHRRCPVTRLVRTQASLPSWGPEPRRPPLNVFEFNDEALPRFQLLCVKARLALTSPGRRQTRSLGVGKLGISSASLGVRIRGLFGEFGAQTNPGKGEPGAWASRGRKRSRG